MATPSDERRSAPHLIAACDVTKLPIGAMEGFVLSRVDGASSISEIAAVTGLAREEITRILEQLATLGAVQLPGFTPPEPPKASPPDPPPRALPSRPAPVWDKSLLDEPADLEVDVKRRILDSFHEMEELDHYELLGLARDADRKAIKGAYYALASTFHTDRYFGKNLGSFKTKMEQIFGKITAAHDTLANKKRREEYDQYIIERDRTRAYERLLAAVDQGESLSEAMAPAAPAARPSPIPAEEPAGVRSTARMIAAPILPLLDEPPPHVEHVAQTPPASATPSAASSVPPGAAPRLSEHDRARREQLARRLLGQRPSAQRMQAVTASRAASTAPPVVAPAEAHAARDGIKRRYEESKDAAKRAQAKHFVDAAKEALGKDDHVAAANQYRLAIRYTDDPEVHLAYEETNRRARTVLAAAYLKQARYEEGLQKWREAALSYAKAAEGNPEEAEIAERAANALRREGRDLHGAARYAETAVQKNPNNAAFRVTLGHVYLDAGLFLRAKSELEHALKLSPGDAKVKELLAHARKAAP